MLVHWLMDKSEKFLAAYQKSNAISLSTESDGNSDDPAYTKIPKMLASAKIKQKHIVVVNKFFVSYNHKLNLKEYLIEKHTDKDVNLLHGVISNESPNRKVEEGLFQETNKDRESVIDRKLDHHKLEIKNMNTMQGENITSMKFNYNTSEESKDNMLDKYDKVVGNHKLENEYDHKRNHSNNEMSSPNYNATERIFAKNQPKSNHSNIYNKDEENQSPDKKVHYFKANLKI